MLLTTADPARRQLLADTLERAEKRRPNRGSCNRADRASGNAAEDQAGPRGGPGGCAFRSPFVASIRALVHASRNAKPRATASVLRLALLVA